MKAMKRIFLPFTVIVLVIISSCADKEKIQLFNGTNLDNWTFFLPDTIEQASVFRVQDGNIFVGGIPNGYIRTRDQYSNYDLHVEWRWLAEPKNSGVLLHATGEDMIWPNCIEAQLKSGHAGDFVLIGKGVGLTVNGTAYLVESEENRYKVADKFEESSENPPGEWNTYDISVSESGIELVVNGVLQNRCTAPTKTKGHICIQSEGGPMEFRNIYLVEK
jgi:hypothetical protein